MGTYRLTDKDGKKYKVTADTPEAAYDAFNKMQGGATGDAPTVPSPAEVAAPAPAVPDVPIQPVPGDDWRQKEAASALEAVSPTVVPAEAGIVGDQRGSLLPISR